MFITLRSTALTACMILACGGAALAGDFGHRGHGHYRPNCEPAYKVVYQTHYREVKVVKHKQERITDYVEQVCTVPREVVETLYKEIQDVVYTTITDYRVEQVDRGRYEREACYDAHGCVTYKQVWVPRLCTIKVPYERVVEKYVVRQVPYQATRTVYDKVIKKVPVEKVIEVPYEVIERVPYQVALKVPCAPQHTQVAY